MKGAPALKNTEKETVLQKIRKNKVCYAMISPYVFLFFCFTVIPVLMSIGLSFTYYNMLESPRFIFLENYRRLFLNDDVFLIAMKNTLIFAAITAPVGYASCFLLAWIINQFKPITRAILTVCFYAPSISGSVYVIWSIMFSSDTYGYINSLLMRYGIIRDPVKWLEDPRYTLGVVILVALWLSIGTSFLSFIAGLQGVDRFQYEAGKIDGIRNRFQELWYITLPNMIPMLLFGAVIQIAGSFGVGDITANLAGMPSVDYSVHTIVNHIADYGNIRFELGYASAIATILFILMVFINKAAQKLIRKAGT